MARQGARTSTRRRREFTKEETLARHPIMLLFDMSPVRTVLSWRGEAGLHFRDLQFLLCKDAPTGGLPEELRECPRETDCQKCKLFKRCVLKESMVWLNQIPENDRQRMRIYRNKTNLADDLGRLCSVGYLKRRARGYYERDQEVHQVGMKGLLRKSLRLLVEKCPENMIHVDGDAVFLYMNEGAISELSKGDKTLSFQINQVTERLAKVRVNDALLEIGCAFDKELLRLTDDRKRVHLWRYVCNHITTRLASFGISEPYLLDGARRIFDIDFGTEKARFQDISRELESEEAMLKEAKQRMSRVMWLDGLARTDAERYSLLTTEYLFSLDPECRKFLREGRPSDKLKVAWKEKSKSLTGRASISHPDKMAWIVHDGTAEFEIRDSGRWLRVYSKKPDEKSDLSEVDLVRQLLIEEEEFQKWFEKSEMYMSLDLPSGGPILLIGVLGS